MRIGIVGCGAICRRSHLPALRRLPWADVHAAYDTELSRAKSVADEFSIPHVHSSFIEFVADTEFDTAIILTPPEAYSQLVPPLVEAGKNILVEKTLAANRDGARMVRDTVDATSGAVRLGVAYNYRYFPVIQRAKKRLQEGALGRPVSLHVFLHQHFPLQWDLSQWRFASGHGVLDDLAPHAIDLLLWLIDDKPVSVAAFGRDPASQFTFVTHATVVVEFRNGTVGVAEVSWLTGPMALRLDLWGTGGRLFVDPLYGGFDERHGVMTPVEDAVALLGKFRYTATQMFRGRMFWDPGSHYVQIYRDFKDHLEGRRNDFPGPQHGAAVLAVIDAAMASLAESRRILLVDLI